MRNLEELTAYIQEVANRKIETAQFDYEQGANDCKMGIYDKWYRYHRHDDGDAYNCGWYYQNQITLNDKVTFLDGE